MALYAGRWVAFVGERVVGQGGTPEQARVAALVSRSKEKPKVVYIPTMVPLDFPPILQMVADALPPDLPVYLVGGAVRDALLHKKLHDLDFILPADAVKISRRVADHLGASFFPLDTEYDTGRVILNSPDGIRFTMDFAARRGADLEADLRGRDFTVNAMAVDIRNPQAILDPLGGAADLVQKQLRSCSHDAFLHDPIRILRGVRLAAVLSFHILPDTRTQMRYAVPLLPQVSCERLRDELFRLLDGPRIAASVRALDMLGALTYVLPELDQLKSVEQSAPHHHDVWEHTLEVIRNLERIFTALAPAFNEEAASNLTLGLVVLRLGKYRKQIWQHLSDKLNIDRSIKPLIFLTALYHDVGKPGTRKEDEEGRIRFFGHDELGARIVRKRLTNLRLSNPEIDRASRIVLGHLRPMLLEKDGHMPTRRAMYRFYRDMGPAGVDICLLSLADYLGTYSTALPQDQWAHHLNVIYCLLEAWWDYPLKQVRPPILVNGHDLMDALNISPGVEVGELLEAIREAQAIGRINHRAEALDYARKIHREQLNTPH